MFPGPSSPCIEHWQVAVIGSKTDALAWQR